MKTSLSFSLIMIVFCTKILGQEGKHDFIVFVGQKISIKKVGGQNIYVEYDTIINGGDTTCKLKSMGWNMNDKYLAKYRVLEVVQGALKSDTIDFFVFSHNNRIAAMFDQETVLLFVYNYNDTFYHEKYQYFDLYRTKNGRWASPYSSSDYGDNYDSITVKPEKIVFKDQLSFKLESNDPQCIHHVYPTPYYKIKDGSAIAVYGNYVEQLAILRQETVIRARHNP